jgi:hypothetical protein
MPIGKIVAYLEAIEAINEAERAQDPVQIKRACEAARVAWEAIPANLQKRMSPPPKPECD